MRPDDFDLLPSVSSLSEEAADSLTGPDATAFDLPSVEISDEEFRSALHGKVAILESLLSVAEDSATNRTAVGAGQAATQRALVPESTTIPDEVLYCYAEAAALRYMFSMSALTPLPRRLGEPPLPRYSQCDGSHRNAVFAFLTARCEVVSDVTGHVHWMIRDVERRNQLKRLLDRGMLELGLNQAQEDARRERHAQADKVEPASASDQVEQTLWKCLNRSAPSLDQQNRAQLLVTLRVAEWLRDLAPILGVPLPEAVQQHLARETLLQPFRHLTGEWRAGGFVSSFIGREEELSRLYDYLAILPPDSFRQRVTRTLLAVSEAWRAVARSRGHRPLLIHGPGGVGKSTLLAKFLLDHLTEVKPSNRFPFVYLDFDLSVLTAREPLTLLAEAARQLAAEYSDQQTQWNAAREKWLEAVRGTAVDAQLRKKALEDFANLLQASGKGESVVRSQFKKGLPFLIILDTFEEVQYHDRDGVKDLFRFLNEFTRQIPPLRVILMGRAPLSDVESEFGGIESVAIEGDALGTGLRTDFEVNEVLLGDLEPEYAKRYLMNQGVFDKDLAEELVEVVGGSPLTLRLIARLLNEGGVSLQSIRDEIKWRPGLPDWLRSRKIPPKNVLQGVLFHRILGHIGDEKIRQLAHPGLILRRITKELIKEVLAEPCGLAPVDDALASAYFSELEREVSLVGTDRAAEGEPVLRHRPELRRIMLRLMEADATKTEQIRQVHEGAIKFYAARIGPVGQQELLYHRLMVNDFPRPDGLLDAIPTEEAIEAGFVPCPPPEQDLRSAWRALARNAPELSFEGRAYLAARVHHEFVSDADWPKANPRDYELWILGKCSRRARERGNLISAHHSLQSHRQTLTSIVSTLSPLSPLPLIEIALLEQLERYSEVEESIRQALSQLSSVSTHQRRVIEYSLLGARAAAHDGDGPLCDIHLAFAHRALERTLVNAGNHLAPAQRCARQFARLAADCINIHPTPTAFETLKRVLFDQPSELTGISDCPAVARYAVASALSELPTHPGFLKVDPPQLTSWLPALFGRLPSSAAARAAEVLADWSVSLLTSGFAEIVNRTLRLSGGSRDRQNLRDAWWTNLLAASLDFGPRMAELITTTRTQSAKILELYRALKPLPEDQSRGEDPFSEACRLGDAIPGEAPRSSLHGRAS